MRDTMRSIISLTLFLKLISFSDSQQLKLTQTPGKLQSGRTGPVKLECQPIGTGFMDYGVFWFRQRKGASSPESILYQSNMANKVTQSNIPNKDSFKSTKGGTSYNLEINPFGEKDQGIYYCLVNSKLVLYISPGVSLYYPTVTTPKPTTKARVTAKAPNKQDPPPKDPCNCETNASKKDAFKEPFCELLIWAPLAGLCGLLLIALLTTSILLCKRTRRRHCRCKHVPLNEKNGKGRPPGRVV
ncbi:T-cell surface glyco CD8 alpha chain [Pelobates cultripes]|uniref:T-cell surface glycoprotein CD8 alpha chain n=1 Tax=Pelobates cultripes TaxID=61616 RepID=A0AAD1WCV6_PELCU|nr:T-cell surface glyco CD8 alpha chain [Pelobates cultripes]